MIKLFMTNAKQTNQSLCIPKILNIVIFFVALSISWGLLWLSSHGDNIWFIFLGAWGFALFHNTIFSLLHEAVHGIFSPNPWVNKVFGNTTAATFPTSFTLQKIAHLGHHNRNRTDKELYDYYLPHESKALRNVWLYGGNYFSLWKGVRPAPPMHSPAQYPFHSGGSSAS
jgi:fatty acid desaturase